MPALHSHTHCQATQANAQTQGWQKECICPNARQNRQKNGLTKKKHDALTCVWHHAG